VLHFCNIAAPAHQALPWVLRMSNRPRAITDPALVGRAAKVSVQPPVAARTPPVAAF
jgi:hypothetical protein